MAHKPCAKYQYVVTSTGPKILPVPELECKDEESPADYNIGGYLPVKVTDTFKHARYKILRKLGWGHFSTVWLVKDTQLGVHSALKVVKSAGRYAETARDEIKLLSQVAAASPHHPGREHVVSFLDSFCHKGPEASHICIVFEPLGENLLALIERNKKSGVPRSIVKIITKQILLGLQYLHDECDLVHTDIKPENILIAIPDVESHIHTELSFSPTASSVHVGIPPSTKNTRTGLTIPHSSHAPRRQVQIFESQPLSSPGRRSGSNSASGSFNPPVQMSRLSAATNASSVKSTVQQLNNAFSKPPSLTHRLQPHSSEAANSPSTSSSSSSISATSVTTGTSSSMISTPPTSLSHSIGNVPGGLTAIAKQVNAPADNKAESKPLPMLKPSASATEPGTSSSWRDKIGVPSSWTDKLPSALKPAQDNHLDRPAHHSSGSNGHTRRTSKGAPWKAPGASLAPAVVVPASVSSSGDNVVEVTEAGPSTRSSSATFQLKTGGQSTPTLHTTDDANDRRSTVSPSPLSSGSPAHLPSQTPQPQPSLLTRTAPSRHVAPNGPLHLERHMSPKLQVSHLSAHMHHRPPDSPGIPAVTKPKADVPPRQATPPTSITPTPALSIRSPITPPPTPSSQPSSPLLKFKSPAIDSILATQVEVPPILDTVTHPSLYPITVKIADLGNATPSKKHYTEDIQTRQYRAPEAILGRKDWGTRADIWSVACVMFELLTADYLFDPQGQGELFTKDDDHMAQIIELMGEFPLDAKMGGKYSRELFDHQGQLRYIRTLKPWPLKRVLAEKYSFSATDATELVDFMAPLLAPDMRERKEAREMVNHPWLTVPVDEDFSQDW